MRLSPTIKTAILLGALTALLIVIGYLISGFGGAVLFFILSLLINIGSYWFSDKIALSMAHAKPIEESQAPQIYEDIRDLTQKMGIPMPRVYYTEDLQPNAFATGRDPNNSAVVITKGLLNILNRDEVRGVLSHELSHIKNRDVLISTIAAVLAGAITSIANLAIFFGTTGSERNRNPLADLLLIIITPIAATLIQLAVSRSREYEADANGSRVTGRPQDLANALIKLDRATKQIPYMNVNPALSSLFIQNPFRGEALLNLFSTHPPTDKRVERLMSMQK